MEILKIVQIIVAVLLMVSILMQNRGSGLSGIFGGVGGGNFSTRRGFEKKLFIATIALAVIFIAVSIASVII